MELIKKVDSQTDKTQKFIFKNEAGFIVEFSYIDNNTNKDIICVPTHTMCNVGCKFCHTTDYIGKIESVSLDRKEIFDGVDYVVNNTAIKDNKRLLLISYMGCGEPMKNLHGLMMSMNDIKAAYKKRIRFAVATSLPKDCWLEFFNFTKIVEKTKLDVKVHLSLHYTNDEIRKKWMPASLEIEPSIEAVEFYHQLTKNAIEIHYALIEGVNDTCRDRVELCRLLKGKSFNVKFLFYNEKESIEAHASSLEVYKDFEDLLKLCNISSEYYMSPGREIGSSCGAFLMDYYLEEKGKI